MSEFGEVRARIADCRMLRDDIVGAARTESANAAKLVVQRGEPYIPDPRLVGRGDPDTRIMLFFAEGVRLPSEPLRIKVQSIVSELAACLNQIVQQLARRNGLNDVSGIDFMAEESEEKFLANSKKLQKSLRQNDFFLLKTVSIREDGNDPLRALRVLEKERKHYRPLGWACLAHPRFGGPGHIIELRHQTALVEEVGKLYEMGNGKNITLKMGIRTDLAFTNPPSARGRNVLGLIDDCINEVERIVTLFEQT
jgi:hypothetical protein